MNRTDRKATLQTLVSERVLSENGKNWLIQVTDPFHDTPVTLTGMPDVNIGSSVVQEIKKTISFGAVTGTVGAGNWDVNIVMWPVFNNAPTPSTQVYPINWTGGGYNPGLMTTTAGSSLQPYRIGGITANQAPPGGTTFGSAVGGSDGGTNFVAPDPAYLQGPCRVIGMGFEVVNSTAELYKQGSVTVWRQPLPAPSHTKTTMALTTATTLDEPLPVHKRVRKIKESKEKSEEPPFEPKKKKKTAEGNPGDPGNALPTALGFINVVNAVQPPGTLADAMLLDGSQTWDAKDGVYCVGVMNANDNPAKVMEPTAYASWTTEITKNAQGTAMVSPQLFVASATTSVITPGDVQHIAPYHLTGAYFTGLSAQNINADCKMVHRKISFAT